MDAAGMSDRGQVREKNEDSYLICREGPIWLFAVADGMGGHAAGEVASTLALEALSSYLSAHGRELLEGAVPAHIFVHNMLARANLKVLEAARADRSQSGMGTTLTLILGWENNFWLGHVGDSRAYRINNDGIFPLTEDHTLVSQLLRNGRISEEETNGHPQRHILTRALGTENSEEFDIAPLDFSPGDAVLLCSDGLYSQVDDNEILAAVRSGGEPSAVIAHLVRLANERGGTDNITAVLFRV